MMDSRGFLLSTGMNDPGPRRIDFFEGAAKPSNCCIVVGYGGGFESSFFLWSFVFLL